MRDLMKCCKIFYDMHVSMTKQSGDFQKLIFTETITHNSIDIGYFLCILNTLSQTAGRCAETMRIILFSEMVFD